MQERNIMVANTEDQTRKIIKSSAETLGELKADFDANGIRYQGLDITEGISKTKLKSNDQQLPRQVKYKEELTDNLVILITKGEKKISSGAAYDRHELYRQVKQYDLAEAVKETFGRNFTQVSTTALLDFLKEKGVYNTVMEEEHVFDKGNDQPSNTCSDCPCNNHQCADDLEDDEDIDEGLEDEEEDEEEEQNHTSKVADEILNLILSLAQKKVLTYVDLEIMSNTLTTTADQVKASNDLSMSAGGVEITDADIDEMIAGI